MKKALITGVNGQDGSYLAETLLKKGYNVLGTIRRASSFNTKRIDHLNDHEYFNTAYSDLTDSSNLHRLIRDYRPDEIYNLGAQSHVAVSFDLPEYTAEVTGVGTVRLLDAIRDNGLNTRFYQASTSELFGGLPETAPQSEQTNFHPKSPYGVAKLYSYWITVNYRESYKLHASNGILFNHESPRRGETFVTKKIANAVAKIHAGQLSHLELGNLDASRDWGHAKDYVEAMWLMCQADAPDDYVIATGKTHTVRDFVEKAFAVVDTDIVWSGDGINEIGCCKNTGQIKVCINPKYFRPAEVELLHGNPEKANKSLNWRPKISYEELVVEMVEAELKEEKNVT